MGSTWVWEWPPQDWRVLMLCPNWADWTCNITHMWSATLSALPAKQIPPNFLPMINQIWQRVRVLNACVKHNFDQFKEGMKLIGLEFENLPLPTWSCDHLNKILILQMKNWKVLTIQPTVYTSHKIQCLFCVYIMGPSPPTLGIMREQCWTLELNGLQCTKLNKYRKIDHH